MKPKGKCILISVLFLLGAVMLAVPFCFRYQGNEKNKKIIEKLNEDTMLSKADEEETDNSEIQTELPDGVLGYITIEKINIQYAIMEGTTASVLSYYIGHLEGTAGVGENGNCVLAGHHGARNGDFFKYLDRLEPGDMVNVTNSKGDSFDYWVTETYVTHAYDNSIKTQGESSKLTLMTCSDKGTRRLIVHCEK